MNYLFFNHIDQSMIFLFQSLSENFVDYVFASSNKLFHHLIFVEYNESRHGLDSPECGQIALIDVNAEDSNSSLFMFLINIRLDSFAWTTPTK
jgi:hypothetical protein